MISGRVCHVCYRCSSEAVEYSRYSTDVFRLETDHRRVTQVQCIVLISMRERERERA